MKNLLHLPKKIIIFGAVACLALNLIMSGGQSLNVFAFAMAGTNPFLAISLVIMVAPLALILTNSVYPGKSLSPLDSVMQIGFLFVYAITVPMMALTGYPPVFLYIGLAVWFCILMLLALGRYLYNIAKLPRRAQMKYAIGFAVVLIVPAIYFAAVNSGSKAEFDKVNGMVQSLADDKLKAAGATELTQNAQYRKGGAFSRDNCDFENTCPSVHREWLVLMDKSYAARQAFIESMLKSQGYEYKMSDMNEYDFNAAGIKDGVEFIIAAKQPGDVKLPSAAPDKKIWQIVSISTGGNVNGPWTPSTKEKLSMTGYTSKYKSYSFAYPSGWKIDDRSTPEKDEIIITSADGKLGDQPSPEPKAASGQVLQIAVTPCPSGRECSLEGVYDGDHNISLHNPEIELDDGTKAASFSFQYLGEEGTDYVVFFRGGKKYTITYNVAGKGRGEISQGGLNATVKNSAVESFRFTD